MRLIRNKRISTTQSNSTGQRAPRMMWLIALLSVAIVPVASASVKSKSTEEFVQIGRDAFFVFTATCDNDQTRVLQRSADGGPWCVKGSDDFCNEDKDQAAQRACGSEYTELVAAQQREQQAKEAAEKERQRAAAAAERERQEKLRAEQESALAAEQAKARQAAEAKQQAEAQAAAKRQADLAAKQKAEQELLKIEEEQDALRREEAELEQRAAEIEALLLPEKAG